MLHDAPYLALTTLEQEIPNMPGTSANGLLLKCPVVLLCIVNNYSQRAIFLDLPCYSSPR